MSGKGDTPRPLSVPASVYAERWERTFKGPSLTDITRASVCSGVTTSVWSEYDMTTQRAEANADAPTPNEEKP